MDAVELLSSRADPWRTARPCRAPSRRQGGGHRAFCARVHVVLSPNAGRDRLRRSDGWSVGADHRRHEDLERIGADNPITTVKQGLFHFEYRAYPEIALREVLMNAFCHTDLRAGGPIIVKHYPTKIVIGNPGGFIAGITPGTSSITLPHRETRCSSTPSDPAPPHQPEQPGHPQDLQGDAGRGQGAATH